MLRLTAVFRTALNPLNQFSCLGDVLVPSIRGTFFPVRSLIVEETNAPLRYIRDTICSVDDTALIVRSTDLLQEHTDATV